MGKKRAPERDRAREIFLKNKGRIAPKEIAERLNVPPETVRKWKYEDKWEEELKRPRPGPPLGSKNAKGHGAPKGNTNAEKHGAYSRPRWDRLTEEQRREIESIQAGFDENAMRSLRRLEAKRADLEGRIAELQTVPGEPEEAKYLDRVMIMELPDGGEMNYISKSTAFSRRMTLEAELNRTDGRINKLLDSMKSAQVERERITIERERLELAKQRALGQFNVSDQGEIMPLDEEDEDRIID